MSNVDAQRVVGIMGEALDMLRYMAYVTPPLLSRAEQLEGPLGPELSTALVQHRGAAEEADAATAKGFIEPSEALATSSRNLCRILKANPAALARLQLLQPEQSPALLLLIQALTKLRSTVQRRLSTTVEEESSKRTFLEELIRREEKAGKEQQSLEQQLRLERRERSRALQQSFEAEKRTRDELEAIKGQTVAAAEKLAGDSQAALEEERQHYQEREASVSGEVAKLREELEKVQAENREAEANLRNKKAKSEEEVLQWLRDYDNDMGAREAEFQQLSAAYAEMKEQLMEYQAHYHKLELEEEKRKEEERRLALIKEQEEKTQKMLNDAASRIQRMWRKHQDRVKEQTKKAKKSKGDPKKGGKAGKTGKATPTKTTAKPKSPKK